MVLEERKALLHRHFQHVVNAFAFVFHFQRLTVVALALAYIARNVNVGQKVHLDFNNAIALARLAAAALNVERKAPGGKAVHFRFRCAGVQLADIRKHARIRRRV